MAKQTLKSLLGNSDEREQVELNLNPIALQPTIRGGGNYRVAVQQTPKTNAALQLSQALKDGVGVYTKAVETVQSKALQDVATMSEGDFDKFLNEGLDEESRSIFGYTKAYNQALAKKYYAEVMPTKLQAIASELHSDPYKYKTVEEFEAASMEAVNGAYDEADELLGGNVFGNQANNALKSATKADFVKKQQAVFLQKLPEITRTVQSDIAFKAFSELDDVANAKASIDQQILAVTEAVGNRKDAAAIVTKAYLDNIEALAKQEGKEELAQALLDELDDTTVAGLGSQGRRKFGDDNIELFNTSANRLRIEKLEDNLETTSIEGYNKKIANSKIATSAIDVELFRIIQNEGEEAGLAYLKDIEQGIVDGTVTVGGKQYDDTVELQGIRDFVAGVKSNKDLFVYNSKLRFIQSNAQSKRTAVKQLLTQGALASINQEAAGLLLKVKPNPVTGAMDVVYSPEGVSFLSEFNAELERLEFALHDSIASLPEADKIDKFSELYPSEVNEAMKSWVAGKLDSLVPTEPEVEVPTALEAQLADEFKEIDNNVLLSASDKEKAKRLLIEDEQADLDSINFIVKSDGSRQLIGVNEPFIDPTAPYKRALEAGQFKDSEEQSQGFDAVHSSFHPNSIKRNNALNRYNSKPIFREHTFIEKAEKKGKLRNKFSLYGLSLQEIADDSFRGSGINRNSVSITDIYGEGNPFSSVPIVYNGSIKNTVKVVQDYFKDSTIPLPQSFKQAADNYGISVETMMIQMEAYLLTNNFISK